MKRCSLRQLPTRDFRIVSSLARMRESRSLASSAESLWPARIASTIASPVRPVRSLIYVLNLEIHLRQRLVHMLHVLAGGLHQFTPVAHQNTHRTYVRFRPESPTQ